jgi:hypothetical protein
MKSGRYQPHLRSTRFTEAGPPHWRVGSAAGDEIAVRQEGFTSLAKESSPRWIPGRWSEQHDPRKSRVEHCAPDRPVRPFWL